MVPQVSRRSLLAAAVSDDGHFLAVGGGQGLVHLYDARSRELVKVCGASCSRDGSQSTGLCSSGAALGWCTCTMRDPGSS